MNYEKRIEWTKDLSSDCKEVPLTENSKETCLIAVVSNKRVKIYRHEGDQYYFVELDNSGTSRSYTQMTAKEYDTWLKGEEPLIRELRKGFDLAMM